ncbi:hypothetical protein NSE_0611 [Neorickettsia sennetsu str. Miyayama]|uniref:Uncharacterized protein n=1 Tax=Ehrlichia sennetsu (strain ATCC VR-367 / Miyayama) TaxID=222891 RepID=Q2GDF5_EHRS3|nr:hypothetical protein NSE_0611 [Neorickettsia sennetsu str. Miyayama]
MIVPLIWDHRESSLPKDFFLGCVIPLCVCLSHTRNKSVLKEW